MLPVRTPNRTYRTLEEIRQRKDELAAGIQHDSDRFGALWNKLFVSRKASTRGEWVSGLIANGVTAVDTFLLVRKLMKNYGHLFRRKKKS